MTCATLIYPILSMSTLLTPIIATTWVPVIINPPEAASFTGKVISLDNSKRIGKSGVVEKPNMTIPPAKTTKFPTKAKGIRQSKDIKDTLEHTRIAFLYLHVF